jgi:hypothetical protein
MLQENQKASSIPVTKCISGLVPACDPANTGDLAQFVERLLRDDNLFLCFQIPDFYTILACPYFSTFLDISQ